MRVGVILGHPGYSPGCW